MFRYVKVKKDKERYIIVFGWRRLYKDMVFEFCVRVYVVYIVRKLKQFKEKFID